MEDQRRHGDRVVGEVREQPAQGVHSPGLLGHLGVDDDGEPGGAVVLTQQHPQAVGRLGR